jgi:ABC-2 type transport system ATP-binding protein
VAQGTPAELKQQTNTETLEAAFLALTGNSIRAEGADSNQSLRNMAQMWRKKR